jgi:hypothetical protein
MYGAYRTLLPDHEGMEPLDGSLSNYQLVVEPQADGSIEVILDGGNFKGITFLLTKFFSKNRRSLS